jgi:hypothetical protein
MGFIIFLSVLVLLDTGGGLLAGARPLSLLQVGGWEEGITGLTDAKSGILAKPRASSASYVYFSTPLN